MAAKKKTTTAKEREEELSFFLDSAHEALAEAWVLAKRLRHRAIALRLNGLLTHHTGPLAWEAEQRVKALQ